MFSGVLKVHCRKDNAVYISATSQIGRKINGLTGHLTSVQVTEGVNFKPGSSIGCVKCIYSEGSWRCGEKSVPLSKYCSKHILHVSIAPKYCIFTLLK